MTKRIRMIACLGAAALGVVCVVYAASPKPAAADLFPDKVLAKGKDFEIKQSQVDEAYLAFKANAAARGQQVPDAQRSDIEKRILERLISVQVLMSKATEADKTKAKAAAEKFLAESKRQAPSEEAFNRQLHALGMSPEQFQKDIQDRAIVEEVLEREMRSKIEVSDAEAKKFYEENPDRFQQPEMVRASHILRKTVDAMNRPLPDEEKKKQRELAAQLQKRAKSGEDFAKLAQEFSEDPGSKDRGGEYTFPRGQMVPQFEAAAFALEPNAVSDVVETQFGFHIIKLSEKIPARKIPYAEVEERLKEGLRMQEYQKQLPAYLEKAQEEAGVQIVEQKQP